jgi:hypothetical protein
MQKRGSVNRLTAPWSIYEVHLGSWKKGSEGGPLVSGAGEDFTACPDMGFTRRLPSWSILLPILGIPGFAPTARWRASGPCLVDRSPRRIGSSPTGCLRTFP